MRTLWVPYIISLDGSRIKFFGRLGNFIEYFDELECLWSDEQGVAYRLIEVPEKRYCDGPVQHEELFWSVMRIYINDSKDLPCQKTQQLSLSKSK